MGVMAEKPANALVPEDAKPYTTIDLGVWRVLLHKDVVSKTYGISMEKWNMAVLAYPLLLRFLREVYDLNPLLVALVVLLKLWEGVESVLMLYVSSRLLQIVILVRDMSYYL